VVATLRRAGSFVTPPLVAAAYEVGDISEGRMLSCGGAGNIPRSISRVIAMDACRKRAEKGDKDAVK
jgi:hypothetical protein